MHPKKLRDRFKKAHEAWTKQLKADLGKAPPKTETLKGWVNNAVNTIKAMPNNANFTSDATNELINLRDRISKVFKPKRNLKRSKRRLMLGLKYFNPGQ